MVRISSIEQTGRGESRAGTGRRASAEGAHRFASDSVRAEVRRGAETGRSLAHAADVAGGRSGRVNADDTTAVLFVGVVRNVRAGADTASGGFEVDFTCDAANTLAGQTTSTSSAAGSGELAFGGSERAGNDGW